MLIHNVFFTLAVQSDANRDLLIAACRKYLVKHPGVVFFACGGLAQELNRDVNVRDFDVGLHIVFEDQASHDAYQDAPSHHQFINESKHLWSRVRVFDSIASK